MNIFKMKVLSVGCVLSVLAAVSPRSLPAQAADPVKPPSYLEWVDGAGKGDSEKAYMLGMAYYYSMFGAEKDNAKARQWFLKAANAGNGRACRQLGDMYYSGWGVPAAKGEAMKWYRKGSDKGDAEAQEKLADMYYYGEGAGRDYSEAFKLYRKAAETASEPGPSAKLGRMYMMGEGVKQDQPEALKWFLKADGMGDKQVPAYIAELYRANLGIKKDLPKAVEWLIKGSVQGDVVAMQRLAEAYADGEGVAQSDLEAYKWLSVVLAKEKNVPAEQLFARVAKKMSFLEQASAKRQASALVKKYVGDQD